MGWIRRDLGGRAPHTGPHLEFLASWTTGGCALEPLLHRLHLWALEPGTDNELRTTYSILDFEEYHHSLFTHLFSNLLSKTCNYNGAQPFLLFCCLIGALSIGAHANQAQTAATQVIANSGHDDMIVRFPSTYSRYEKLEASKLGVARNLT